MARAARRARRRVASPAAPDALYRAGRYRAGRYRAGRYRAFGAVPNT
jgi:hypothetical protein